MPHRAVALCRICGRSCATRGAGGTHLSWPERHFPRFERRQRQSCAKDFAAVVWGGADVGQSPGMRTCDGVPHVGRCGAVGGAVGGAVLILLMPSDAHGRGGLRAMAAPAGQGSPPLPLGLAFGRSFGVWRRPRPAGFIACSGRFLLSRSCDGSSGFFRLCSSCRWDQNGPSDVGRH